MQTNSLTNIASSSAPANTAKPKRYHPLVVTLHWLVGLVMFSAFLLKPEGGEGRFRPEGDGVGQPDFSQPGNFPPPANFTPRTPPLDIHMVLGGVLLLLMLVRVIVRFATKDPAWATTGNVLFDWLGWLTHLGLYLLTFAILGFGGILAYREGLIAKVLGLTATSQGIDRGGFIFRGLHELSWNLIFLLLFLHIGAALYHQFIRKDNLLGRMWFGKET